jgi:hypothetical protein
MCLLLVIVQWVGGKVCDQLLPNLRLKQNTWLLLKHVKESVWLKYLYAKLYGDGSCITHVCDSQSAICLTKDQMFHEKTHIDIKTIMWDTWSLKVN